MTELTVEQPTLSVLLPAHNAADTLASAVQSMFAQTFKDFELLILNDGSTDKTGDVARKLSEQDPRVRYHEFARDGLVATLNRGLELACAPLIARMDADDFALPHRFSRQIEFLEARKDVALVGSGLLDCDSDLTPTGEIRLPTSSGAIRNHLLNHGNAFAHPTVMFRKQAVLDCGGYNAFFKDAEDYALWLELSNRHRLANIDECLLMYRRSATSVSATRLLQQVISELAARLAAKAGRSIADGRQARCANVQTVLSLGGTVTQVEDLFAQRGGTLELWTEIEKLAWSPGRQGR